MDQSHKAFFMSLLQKLNPFHRATPDEQLVSWIVGVEDRREKAEKVWRKENNLGPYLAHEWAQPRDLEKLALILEVGVDLDRVMPARRGAKENFAPSHHQERPLLDAMLEVSAQGAKLLIQHGAKPTQNTVDRLARLAIDYTQTHTNGKLTLGYLNARLPDPAFDYQDIALDLIKVEGLQWYGTHQCAGSGRRRLISTANALRQAFSSSKAEVSFHTALEEEQARRGWQVGHPPMAQWIAWPGRPASSSEATSALARTVEEEEILFHPERLDRIQELLDLGADPTIKQRDFWKRKEEPVSLIGLTILDRDWQAMDKLAKAGASIDWEVCDSMVAKWITRYVTPRNGGGNSGESLTDDAKTLRWRIGDLLKSIGKHEPIDWQRPFPLNLPEGLRTRLPKNETPPKTWGELIEFCGEELRAEIEQVGLRGLTPQAQATQNQGTRRL